MILEKIMMMKTNNYDNKRMSRRSRRRIRIRIRKRQRKRGNAITFAFLICLLGKFNPPVTFIYGQPGIAHQFLSHENSKSSSRSNTQQNEEQDGQQQQQQQQDQQEEDFDDTCSTETSSSSSSSSACFLSSSSSSSTSTTNGSNGGGSCQTCTRSSSSTTTTTEPPTDTAASSTSFSFSSSESTTTSTSSTTTTSTTDSSSIAKEFFGIFSKLGTSWTNVLKLFVKAVGSAGGKTHRRDVYVDTIDDALVSIKDMINKEKSTTNKKAATDDDDDEQQKLQQQQQQQQQTSSTSSRSTSIWDFDTVPLQAFNKNIEDLYMAYIHWSIADSTNDDINKCNRPGSVNGISSLILLNLDDDDDDSNSSSKSTTKKKSTKNKNKINVSKAFRRLQQYAEWMDDDDLRRSSSTISSLSATSIQEVYELFQIQVTIDDCQRIVWWLDLSKIDFELLHSKINPADIKRYFVWVSHYMLFTKQAQENGLIFVNSLAQISFWTFMTMLPLELGIKIDEFVISVLPLKTKFVVLLERPSWAKFAFGLLKPFLKNDMQKRMIVVEHGLYAIEYLEEIIGPTTQYAITNFVDDLDGNPNVPNIMDEYYYSSI